MFELTPIFILAIIFGTILGIVYLSMRRKEREMMMERGIDASFFSKGVPPSNWPLKYGTLLIGLALGILIGKWLAATESFADAQEAAYFSMIFLFGGLALLVYYFLEKNLRNNQRD